MAMASISRSATIHHEKNVATKKTAIICRMGPDVVPQECVSR